MDHPIAPPLRGVWGEVPEVNAIRNEMELRTLRQIPLTRDLGSVSRDGDDGVSPSRGSPFKQSGFPGRGVRTVVPGMDVCRNARQPPGEGTLLVGPAIVRVEHGRSPLSQVTGEGSQGAAPAGVRAVDGLHRNPRSTESVFKVTHALKADDSWLVAPSIGGRGEVQHHGLQATHRDRQQAVKNLRWPWWIHMGWRKQE